MIDKPLLVCCASILRIVLLLSQCDIPVGALERGCHVFSVHTITSKGPSQQVPLGCCLPGWAWLVPCFPCTYSLPPWFAKLPHVTLL